MSFNSESIGLREYYANLIYLTKCKEACVAMVLNQWQSINHGHREKETNSMSYFSDNLSVKALTAYCLLELAKSAVRSCTDEGCWDMSQQ